MHGNFIPLVFPRGGVFDFKIFPNSDHILNQSNSRIAHGGLLYYNVIYKLMLHLCNNVNKDKLMLLLFYNNVMWCLIHDKECFMRYQTRGADKRFIAYKL